MTAFEVFAKLGLDDSSFYEGIDKAEKSGKNFGNSLANSLGKIKKLAVGVISVAAIKKGIDALRELATETAAAGDRIDKQSQVLGMSRKAYQEWDYILSQNGASIDSMGAAMKTLNSTILSGIDDSEEAKDAFAQLGLSVNDLYTLPQEEQFEAVVRAFQRMPAGAQKSALAVKLFGRQGMQLLPLLNQSSTSIDELRARAEELGFIMSDDAVDAAVVYGDSLDDLHRTFDGFKYAIGSKILPVLTAGIQKVTNFAGKLKKAYDDKGLAGVWDVLVESFRNIKWPTWEDIKNALETAWEAVKEGAKSVLKLIFGESADGGIEFPTAEEVWEKVKTGLVALWDGIKVLAKDILKLVFGESEDGGIDWGTAEGLWYKIGQGLRTLWNGIKNLAKDVLRLVFGESEDGGIDFPSAEETYRAIGGALTAWWSGVRRLAKGVLNLLLGALGLPDVDETVRQIKEWWNDVKQKIALKIFVKVGGYSGFGFNPDAGESWSEGVQKTNEKFGIKPATVTDADIQRWEEEGYAKGLPTVPYDNFVANLHRGEMVLTASQARAYRDGGVNDLSGLKEMIVSAIRSGMSNATVRSYLNGKDITQEVNRQNVNSLKARRYAT